MNAPTVSVLMPVYNCGPYLDEAIRSIRDQTLTDFEFVIVNDGSTDGSLDVVQRHAAEDPRIVVLDRPNGGIVDALNAGLAVCRGEFVARMDGDDVAAPERFAKQLPVLQGDPEVVAVGCSIRFIDPAGEPIRDVSLPTGHEEICRFLQSAQCKICHPAVVMRKGAIGAVGGYREAYRHVEDLDLFLRLSEMGTMANTPETLLLYRIHGASACHTHRLEQSLLGEKAVAESMARRRQYRYRVLGECARNSSRLAYDQGQKLLALRKALRAIALAPLAACGYKALLRIGAREMGLHKAPRPVE